MFCAMLYEKFLQKYFERKNHKFNKINLKFNF